MASSKLFMQRWSPLLRDHFTKRPILPYSQRYYTKKISHIRKAPSHSLKYTLGSMVIVGTTGTLLYATNNPFRRVIQAIERSGISAGVGISVAIDYKWTLSQNYSSVEEEIKAKRECDKRCAERVLAGLQRLGGIYVKLGQHISAMTYILPMEWTSTMEVLQDRCDPSSPDDIEALFLSDYGSSIEDTFEEFDWNPLGVASLAQVHKARLRPFADGSYEGNDGWVAVKLQHPRLDNFCKVDLATVSFLMGNVKRFFPDFGFDWLVQEMQESLPQELNFVHEAANVHKVTHNFAKERAQHTTALVIPGIVRAQRRVMLMEFMEGARIDDLEYMKKHSIDPNSVSTEITKIFSKMIFLHGFLHCDPHAGNIFIRPSSNPKKTGYNFEIVLLDHGLYRTLTDELRTNYAHLWTSLIRGDEEGIRIYAQRVGCRPEAHRLFASLLTGREWDTIQASDLSSDRTNTEVTRVSGRAKNFLFRIADILARLPRVVLLLLKTSDLLRCLDETLRESVSRHMTFIIMGKYCAEAVWIEAKSTLLEKIAFSGFSLHFLRQFFCAWWEYQSLETSLWLYQTHISIQDRWSYGKRV
ncbi:ABC1 family-domain-containing protein [Spinellus fusiger]|nr:ABC1 family-domain-containing protein [Spinellus fusiger]